jgi:hypothetical protein
MGSLSWTFKDRAASGILARTATRGAEWTPRHTDARAWTQENSMTFAFERGGVLKAAAAAGPRKPRFLAAVERACEIFPLNVDECVAFIDGFRAAQRRSN